MLNICMKFCLFFSFKHILFIITSILYVKFCLFFLLNIYYLSLHPYYMLNSVFFFLLNIYYLSLHQYYMLNSVFFFLLNIYYLSLHQYYMLNSVFSFLLNIYYLALHQYYTFIACWWGKFSYFLNLHAINVLLYRMKPRKHIHVKYCWQTYFKFIGTLSQTFKNHRNGLLQVMHSECLWRFPVKER